MGAVIKLRSGNEIKQQCANCGVFLCRSGACNSASWLVCACAASGFQFQCFRTLKWAGRPGWRSVWGEVEGHCGGVVVSDSSVR